MWNHFENEDDRTNNWPEGDNNKIALLLKKAKRQKWQICLPFKKRQKGKNGKFAFLRTGKK